MLNNTKYNSESNDLQGIVENQLVTGLGGMDTTAANAPDFNQGKRPESSIRRDRRRRRSSGFALGGWRVTSW